MPGRWPAGKAEVTYALSWHGESADQVEQGFLSWNRFGLIKVRPSAPGERPDVWATLDSSVPGPDVALTEEPVNDPPGTLNSRWSPAYLNPAAGVPLAVAGAHEFGHALGLGHDDDPGSCMTPVLNGAVDGPTAHDGAVLAALYPELAAAASSAAWTFPFTTGLSVAAPDGPSSYVTFTPPLPAGDYVITIDRKPA